VFSPSSTTASDPAISYNISGGVSGSAATVTLSGTSSRSTTTDSSGKYTFSSVPNGSYVVAASQSAYTFTPSTASVSINGASVAEVNFIATAVPTAIPRSVSLNWTGSSSSNVKGYNVYRADIAGGAYARINASPVSTTAYVDNSVTSGRIYYYVATTVDSADMESTYSNLATAVVPMP
jgi:fibronectin type 3 domain-containing protein